MGTVMDAPDFGEGAGCGMRQTAASYSCGLTFELLRWRVKRCLWMAVRVASCLFI